MARLNCMDPEKLASAGDALRRFEIVHEAQPGYRGGVVVDLRDGRRLVVNFWQSEEHAAAALSVLGPDVARLLAPLMPKPSELVGAGRVVSAKLTEGQGP